MMEKKIQHLKENKALHIYEDKSLLNRASNKKLTLSFNEENKKQNNFLQKGAILKHLVKKIVKNRQINGSSNFRSNRENYHQKVKENTKVPTIVSNYKTGITKDKKFKSNKKTNAPKKKKYFQRKPTTELLDIKSLFEGLKDMSRKQRFQEALRHFKDALYIRNLRIDIVKRHNFIKICYSISTNPIWNNILLSISWIYMILAFFEPINKFDIDNIKNKIKFETLIVTETIILMFLILENLFDIGHRRLMRESGENYWSIVRRNKKTAIKCVINFIFLSDFLSFYIKYPESPFRYSRILRPFMTIFYSKEMKRTIKGILKSIKHMIELLFFYLILILVWALIGFLIINNLDYEILFDKYIAGFDNMSTAFDCIYGLVTLDNYPEIMFPALEYSELYLIYFIPFTILCLLILIPVPVGVAFEAFKKFRGKIVIMDRIKQREALFVCFLYLDYRGEQRIQEENFIELLNKFYSDPKTSKELYDCLDNNNNKTLSIDEFFEVIEVLESHERFAVPFFKRKKFWKDFREKINEKLHFSSIATSFKYNLIIFLLMISNCTILVICEIIHDSKYLAIFSMMDEIFLYLYLIDFVIKILGIGFNEYFSDVWNKFDFMILFISFISEFFLLEYHTSNFDLSTTPQMSNSIKISRFLKLWRMLRILKLLNFLFERSAMISRIKLLIYKMLFVVPIVLSFTPIMFIIIYFYAIVGVEIFNTNYNEYDKNSHNPYAWTNYADFNSFGSAFLLLSQVAIGPKWTLVKGDYAVKFDFILSATFFNSFHFLVIIILLSLLRGLIWEVFIVIDSIIKNEPSQTAAFSLYFENSSIKKNKDDETKNKMAKKQIIFNKKTENQEIQLFSKDLGKTIASMNKTDNSKEIKLGIINENSLSDENSIQNILGKEKIHKKFEISENINEDSSSALYNYNEEKRKQFDFNNKFTDSIVKNPIICHENEIIIEKKSICQSDNTLKVEENHLVEMINRKKKSAPKISSEDSEEILNTKKAPINMNDKQKNIINFYKLKIKRLKYFLHLQDIQKKNSEKDKFDENSHFFHSKDKSSMKILEEYLLESLDDEELTNVFLPENELDPLCTDRFYKNEKGKKKQQGVQYGNNKNFLVKRALLKDFNMEQIKKFEINYFSSIYGEEFHYMREIDVKPLLSYEGGLLQSLLRLLRYKDISCLNYLKVITLMEKKISQILLRNGSFLKFLFKTNGINQWFILDNDSDNDIIKPQYLLSGPWDHYENIFTTNEEIYLSKDIFYYKEQEHSYFSSLLNLSINEIAKTINKTFDSSDKNSIWDLFLINYETNSPKCIQPIVDSSEFYSVSSKKSETNEIINNMMILLLNYQGKALSLNEEESKLEKKETFKTKSMNKSMDKSEKVTSAFRNMKDEKFQNRLDSVNNILKKLESTYFRDKFEREEDRIKGTSNLPFSYVVEMIKDINDVLRLYKENLMVNVTRALYKLKN